uniref:Bromo domain-containing protein n=1 Tax=Macrostomum lignano TaxID=282301 RepID=A0A1I8F400_9PLAT
LDNGVPRPKLEHRGEVWVRNKGCTLAVVESEGGPDVNFVPDRVKTPTPGFADPAKLSNEDSMGSSSASASMMLPPSAAASASAVLNDSHANSAEQQRHLNWVREAGANGRPRTLRRSSTSAAQQAAVSSSSSLPRRLQEPVSTPSETIVDPSLRARSLIGVRPPAHPARAAASKLGSGKYTQAADMLADFELMFDNACLFNETEDHPRSIRMRWCCCGLSWRSVGLLAILDEDPAAAEACPTRTCSTHFARHRAAAPSPVSKSQTFIKTLRMQSDSLVRTPPTLDAVRVEIFHGQLGLACSLQLAASTCKMLKNLLKSEAA